MTPEEHYDAAEADIRNADHAWKEGSLDTAGLFYWRAAAHGALATPPPQPFKTAVHEAALHLRRLYEGGVPEHVRPGMYAAVLELEDLTKGKETRR